MNEAEKRGERRRRRVVRPAGPAAGGAERPAEPADRVTPAAISAEPATAAKESAAVTAATPVPGEPAVQPGAPVPMDAPVVSDESTVKMDTLAAAPEAELWTPKAVPADSGDATPEAEETNERSGRLGWIGWIAAAVAAVSALVMIGSGGFLVYHQHGVNALQERRAAYVQTAKQVVLNLTDISGDTAPQDIDRVLSVASGDLKAEYTQRKDAYAQVIAQAKVKATGEIIEAAIENEDSHTAQVLVAAKQTLTNAGSPDPQQRYYRFRITVSRDDSGQMTGSKVEFVA